MFFTWRQRKNGQLDNEGRTAEAVPRCCQLYKIPVLPNWRGRKCAFSSLLPSFGNTYPRSTLPQDWGRGGMITHHTERRQQPKAPTGRERFSCGFIPHASERRWATEGHPPTPRGHPTSNSPVAKLRPTATPRAGRSLRGVATGNPKGEQERFRRL